MFKKPQIPSFFLFFRFLSSFFLSFCLFYFIFIPEYWLEALGVGTLVPASKHKHVSQQLCGHCASLPPNCVVATAIGYVAISNALSNTESRMRDVMILSLPLMAASSSPQTSDFYYQGGKHHSVLSHLARHVLGRQKGEWQFTGMEPRVS